MICFTDKFLCSGCGVCSDVCPKSCIRMEEDNEGFFYPKVNRTTCIDCSLCERVCPMIGASMSDIKEAYVGVYDPDNSRSASGGAFWAIAELLLKKGYYVAGAKWNDKHKCVHAISSDIIECESFRGSKYVQSDTIGIFNEVKKLLTKGERVCVSGTPCQISAIKNFVGLNKKLNENLLLIDLICHGVSSQRTFNCEIDYLQNKYKKEISSFQFKCKDKRYGTINTRRAKIVFYDGTSKVFDIWEDPFLSGYYSRLFYRPSCEYCKYATDSRVGDITLGDAWDVETVYPELRSTEGVSLVLINSEKGKEIVSELSSHMPLKVVDVEWAIEHNECLREPTRFHDKRNVFFEESSKSFDKRISSIVKRTYKERILYWSRRIYHMIISHN